MSFAQKLSSLSIENDLPTGDKFLPENNFSVENSSHGEARDGKARDREARGREALGEAAAGGVVSGEECRNPSPSPFDGRSSDGKPFDGKPFDDESFDGESFDVESTDGKSARSTSTRSEGGGSKGGGSKGGDSETQGAEKAQDDSTPDHSTLDHSTPDDSTPDHSTLGGEAGGRKRVRQIVSNETLGTSKKIQALLQVGADRLGVENAHLVRIDPADGAHRIVETSGPHPVIEEGATADLSNTYCRKVVAEGGPYAVGDAEAEGWAGDPAYETYGLACYHGTKVVVGEELYGTVCFVDRNPRGGAVGTEESTFVELVAQAIGQVIGQRRRKQAVSEEREKLARMQQLLRRVQRAAKVGGWELDARAEETFWTEEMQLMLGLEEENPELGTILQQMDLKTQKSLRAATERCLENGEPFTVEASLSSGRSGPSASEHVEVHGVPSGRRSEGSGAEKVVGAVRDISDRKRWRKTVEITRRESIHRLARAAEHRDSETGEHIRRVGRLSRLVAEALGKPPEWQERILEAAPLHDVGKIGIADDILLKEGPLTDAEYETIKEHTVIGADLLSGGQSPLIRMTERVARHHHERFDGEGYPDGLKREEIPLAARIVNVADTFDAMTHDRPYREALPPAIAFEEIEEEAGAQFDPQVSQAALDIRGPLSEFT